MNPIQNASSSVSKPAGAWLSLLSSASEKPVTRSPGCVGNAAVVLLIDVSGSMEGASLAQAKQGAADFLHDALSRNYLVGIAAFGSDARILTPPVADQSIVKKAIDTLAIEGSTNMAAGLNACLDCLSGLSGQRAICVVTDGYPDNPEDALRAAGACKAKGIEILTLGTENADHAFLASLATSRDLATATTSKSLRAGMGKLATLLPALAAKSLPLAKK